MSSVSRRTLRILAAVVWCTGGVVLVIKGIALIREAHALNPGAAWPWLAGLGGTAVGVVKARFVFVGSCRRNLQRIAALDRPKLWQFFRPGFFLALAVMIAAGSTLSRLAHGHYGALIGVAVLDLAIAVALLASSHVFWKERVAVLRKPTGRF